MASLCLNHFTHKSSRVKKFNGQAMIKRKILLKPHILWLFLQTQRIHASFKVTGASIGFY